MVSQILLTKKLNDLSSTYGITMTPSKLNLYADTLRDFSDSDFEQAFRNVLCEDRKGFPPTGAFYDACKKIKLDNPSGYIKIEKALESAGNWITWLNLEYLTKKMDDNGKLNPDKILDNCPACRGFGFISGKGKLKDKTYEVGFACNICKTGVDKHERLLIPIFQGKEVCDFHYECMLTENQKQDKCFKCVCKHDKERIK